MKISAITVFFFILLTGCITKFTPETTEDKKILVVEGLITDQPGINTIKLSRSTPLGTRIKAEPVTKCTVSLSDNNGNTYILKESVSGTYVTDPAKFRGQTGQIYTLSIKADNYTYQSYPAEMKYVPPVDSLYYEKVVLGQYGGFNTAEGCQIYLNTGDPSNRCKFYRWEFSETWEFRLPYNEIVVPNNRCWLSDNSDMINIKSTSALEENKIKKYPLTYISNMTDRLSEKYSILVTQYSLTEDEFNFWEKIQKLSEQTGSLYDKIPSAIPSNIYCVDDPGQTVAGYFSVSASSSKRMFIKDNFAGLVNLYINCNSDTVYGNTPIPYLGTNVWVIIDHPIPPPAYRVITYDRGCADCTIRGTKVEPDFWK
jgi:hypothetical protein